MKMYVEYLKPTKVEITVDDKYRELLLENEVDDWEVHDSLFDELIQLLPDILPDYGQENLLGLFDENKHCFHEE